VTDRPAVIDEPDRHRFTVTIDGYVAELTYERTDDRLVLIHTGVPEAVDGRGVGTMLVRAAIEDAAAHQLTVVPRCPFARQYLRRHPEVADRVKIDWPITGSSSHRPGS
jgi:predicted GNAT family acetyltransferase